MSVKELRTQLGSRGIPWADALDKDIVTSIVALPCDHVLSSPSSGKEKAHEHKQDFPVTARVGGGLPTGWPGVSRPPGVKSLCAVCRTQGT